MKKISVFLAILFLQLNSITTCMFDSKNISKVENISENSKILYQFEQKGYKAILEIFYNRSPIFLVSKWPKTQKGRYDILEEADHP